jgi:hypothetical protein
MDFQAVSQHEGVPEQIHPDEYLNRDFKTHLRSADRSSTRDGLLDKAATFMQFLLSSPELREILFQS